MKTFRSEVGSKRSPRVSSGKNVPSPSISTILPARMPRTTICASWCPVAGSATAESSGAFETDPPSVTGAKPAQAGKFGRFSPSKIRQDIVNHTVQAVGGLGVADPCLACDLPGNFRFIHLNLRVSVVRIQTDGDPAGQSA